MSDCRLCEWLRWCWTVLTQTHMFATGSGTLLAHRSRRRARRSSTSSFTGGPSARNQWGKDQHLRFISILLHAFRLLVVVPLDGSCFIHACKAILEQRGRPTKPKDARLAFLEWFETFPLHHTRGPKKGQKKTWQEHYSLFYEAGSSHAAIAGDEGWRLPDPPAKNAGLDAVSTVSVG